MTQIKLDAELRKKLKGCTEPIQLVDEAGKVLAKLTPEPAGKPSPPPYEPPNWTEEEFKRILAGPFVSTEELLDSLDELETK